MYRLYITPQIGTGRPFPPDPYRPKYFGGLTYGGLRYGFQPIFMVAADLTPEQDASIVANPDVDAFPFDLSPIIGGGQALQNAKDILEAALIPAQWINANDTWLSVARTVAAMFSYMQRLYGILGNTVLIDDATKLNVQWQAIPTDTQNAMRQAALSLGYAFNPAQNDQIRQILKTMADQWGDKPFNLNGFIF